MTAFLGTGRGKLLSKMVELNIGEQNMRTPGHQNLFKQDDNEIQCDKKVANVYDDIPQEDIDWQVYKFTRKVKEAVKDIREKDLGKIFGLFQDMIEERPLSSRYTGCSETKQMLEVLIQKSVTDEKFLLYAPRLIKLLHECAEIEFLEYFPELLQEKRNEVMKVCASAEMMISENAKNFCRLLGQLFIVPRQVNNKFYNVVSPIVEEMVKIWTFVETPDGQSFSGHNLSLAQVQATAAHNLIKEIATGMFSCDREITTKLESFVWMTRESVLSNQVPRTLKEIYLDTLIDIQCGSNSKTMSAEQDGDEFDADVEIEEEEDEEQEVKSVVTEEEKDIAFDEEKPLNESIHEEEMKYTTVEYFLKKSDLTDLFPDFLEQKLTDEKIKRVCNETQEFMKTLQGAGISKLLSFNIVKMVNGKGWNIWQLEASQNQSKKSTPTNRSARSSLSDRMAIAFPGFNTKAANSSSKAPKEKQQPEDFDYTVTEKQTEQYATVDVFNQSNNKNEEIPDDSFEIEKGNSKTPDFSLVGNITDEYNYSEASSSDNVDNKEIFSVNKNNPSSSSDSGSDVEIEEDEAEDNLNSNIFSTFKDERRVKRYPLGRGRGMVKFNDGKISRAPKNHVPVAKVSPTGRERKSGRTETFNKSFPGNEQRLVTSQQRPENVNFSKENRDFSNFTKQKLGFSKTRQDSNSFTKNSGDMSKTEQYNTNWRIRNSPPINNRQPPERFQPIQHNKTEPVQQKVESKPISFGTVKPKMCFRCSSLDHITEECSVVNPFF